MGVRGRKKEEKILQVDGQLRSSKGLVLFGDHFVLNLPPGLKQSTGFCHSLLELGLPGKFKEQLWYFSSVYSPSPEKANLVCQNIGDYMKINQLICDHLLNCQPCIQFCFIAKIWLVF